MEFTGERVIPGEGDADLINEHRARYRFAMRYSSGKTVLDAACGSGYGSAMLAENAKRVYAVDISDEAVHYARRHFGSPTVHFCRSDCMALPFPSGQFELVTAFEIIEHLENPEGFLNELRRVLAPTGLLILSTPNRHYYTEERGEKNPFHVREFSFPEFDAILRPLFPYRSILFENHVPGLLLAGPDGKATLPSSIADDIFQETATLADRDAASERRQKEQSAHYFVALCSRRPLDPVFSLLYLPSTGNVLREREIHIRSLSEQLRDFELELKEKSAYVMQLQADYDSKIKWALSLQKELEQAQAALQKLQSDFDGRTQWALGLEQDLELARAALQKLRVEFDDRTQWALSLQQDVEQTRQELKQAEAAANACSEELRAVYSSLWHRIGEKLRLSPKPPSGRF